MSTNIDENLLEGLALEEENIFINLPAKTKEEVITQLGGNLFERGFVKESYVDAVLKREEVYPTGLAAVAAGVAVPHTDAEHVLKPALSIATLNETVEFQHMAEPEKIVPVSVVMMLAVKDPTKIVPVLSKVISIIQNEEAIKNILKAVNPHEVKQIVLEHMKTM